MFSLGVLGVFRWLSVFYIFFDDFRCCFFFCFFCVDAWGWCCFLSKAGLVKGSVCHCFGILTFASGYKSYISHGDVDHGLIDLLFCFKVAHFCRRFSRAISDHLLVAVQGRDMCSFFGGFASSSSKEGYAYIVCLVVFQGPYCKSIATHTFACIGCKGILDWPLEKL